MEKQTITLLLFLKKGKPFFIASQRILPKRSERSISTDKVSVLKDRVLKFYNNFKEQFDPQENVCSTLNSANRIILVHPGNITENEAGRILREFLVRSRKKHGIWMIIDGVLALMGGVLTPLPGPNLFFFYPAARAVSHYFARSGVDTALDLDKKDFTINPLLDTIQDNINNLDKVTVEIEELEKSCLCSHIQRLLK